MRINGETWLLCFLGLMVGSTVLIVVPKIVDQRVRPTEFLDLSLDPPVGSPMPMSVVTATLDAHGRLLPNSLGRIMLVSGGSCSGCSKGAIQFDKLPYQDFDAVYVLYNEPSDKIRQAFPPPPRRNIYLLEDSSSSQNLLNAAWIGRWYAFTNAKLTALQKRSDDRDWGLK